MQRERVTENIYVFTSDLYVQVTVGLVLTSAGAVLIDTMLYPEETIQIRRFVEERLGTTVRYIINTHHHADHTTGTCFFPGAKVISHRLCRDILDTRGRESLSRMKESSTDMADVDLVLPDVVFDDQFSLHFGGRTFQMWSSPGHSPDSIVCLVEEEQVLFAADTVMPIPYFVDGDFDDFKASLQRLRGHGFETIVQGHGEVVLRGEVEDKLRSDVTYLDKLSQAVDKALAQSDDRKVEEALSMITLEMCNKSRVLLNGAAQQLHQKNVMALAKQRKSPVLLQTEFTKD